MAFAESLRRCPLVCSPATVCVLLFAALQCSRVPVPVLRAGASHPLAALSQLRAGSTLGSRSSIPRSQEASASLQSTTNPILLPNSGSPKNDLALNSSLAQTAFDIGGQSSGKRSAQTDERALSSEERRNVSSMAALLRSLERHVASPLTLQGTTGSPWTQQRHLSGDASGTDGASLQKMGTGSIGAAPLAGTVSPGYLKSPSVVATVPSGENHGPSAASLNLPTLTVGPPPKRQAYSPGHGIVTSILSSLRESSTDRGVQVGENGGRDSFHLTGTLYTNGADAASAARPQGMYAAPSRSFPFPYPDTPIQDFRWMDGRPLQANLNGVERFPHLAPNTNSSQGTVSLARHGVVNSLISTLIPAGGASLLEFLASKVGSSSTLPGEQQQQQQALQQAASNLQKYYVQQQSMQFGQDSRRQHDARTNTAQQAPMEHAPSLATLANSWNPYVPQSQVQHTEAQLLYNADGTSAQQAKEAFEGRQTEPPAQGNLPQPNVAGQKQVGTQMSPAQFQLNMEKLGYKYVPLPPTKGVKTMVAALALGMTGALNPTTAATILGIGALKYAWSKRAQAKAAAERVPHCV